MPLTTNALERVVLTGLNSQPALLLDYFSTLGFRAAIAGVRLGVFDALDKGPATAAEVADGLGTGSGDGGSEIGIVHWFPSALDNHAEGVGLE